MSFGGQVFVTPHAVRRFRERIAPLPENHALAAIIHSLASPAVSVRPTQNGRGLAVRTKAPFRFRAFVMPPPEAGGLPSVVSIMRG
jgi:hypothetical protein